MRPELQINRLVPKSTSVASLHTQVGIFYIRRKLRDEACQSRSRGLGYSSPPSSCGISECSVTTLDTRSDQRSPRESVCTEWPRTDCEQKNQAKSDGRAKEMDGEQTIQTCKYLSPFFFSRSSMSIYSYQPQSIGFPKVLGWYKKSRPKLWRQMRGLCKFRTLQHIGHFISTESKQDCRETSQQHQTGQDPHVLVLCGALLVVRLAHLVHERQALLVRQ